ncbi:Gfo/Idh/MocA family protein [Planctomicrobium sp. SH664]|uniref:Gfo/Idh/MocA family protein n=1 Tax=Planctomicrobium sp. SH664 TaxID=3448125 RepID=UPI003F5C3E41
MSTAPHSVLIIGAGSIGERHLHCFLQTERAQVSFVESKADLAGAISDRYPRAKRLTSLEEALQSGVTSAVIATPAPAHLPLAQQCVATGVSVLIEKPLSVSLEGVAELCDALQRSTVKAAVAYVYRANPVLAEMRSVLQSGRYGRPVELVACCGQDFPFYRPAYAQTYYASRASGGGVVQDALTHILNAGEWLLGPIDRVLGDVSHQLLPNVDVEDTAHVLARHGQVLASYVMNQYQAPNEVEITVVCERGTLRFEAQNARWRVMEKPDEPWQDHAVAPFHRDELFLRQAHAFLDLVEGKSAPLCSVEEAARTLQVNLAILKSAERLPWQCLSPLVHCDK